MKHSNDGINPTQSTDNDEPLSQAEMIKQYLKEGNTITTIEAFKLFEITCLAQRIHDLRTKHGLVIDAEPVTYKGKRFMSYKWNDCSEKGVTDDA